MGLNCESISTTSKLYTQNVKLTKRATENSAQIGKLLTNTDTSLATSQNPTPVEISSEEAREAIIVLLGDETYNNLSPELREDVQNKYIALKTIRKMDDSELAPRLTNYIKALQAHQQEVQMGQYFEDAIENDNIASLHNCPITILDTDIADQKVNGSDAEFTQSLVDRGQGYVDLYDANHDDKVNFEEFIALEEADNGRPLTADEIEMTREYFNMLARNDGSIDINEFASHLAATSRLYDTGRAGDPSTPEDITFKEWYGAQMVGTDEFITRNYNIWRNGYQDIFEQE